MSDVDRRQLLRRGAALALMMGCGGCSSRPSASETDTSAPAGETGETGAPEYDPCAFVAGTEAEGWRPYPFDQHPELADEGGWIYADVGDRRIVIGHWRDGCFVAMDRTCTHEGGPIELQNGRFVCQRHGTWFQPDGSVGAGATSVPVNVYPAAERDGAVWVEV